VGYDFTAGLKASSTTISAGEKHLQGGAGAVLARFRAALDETSELRITDVLEKINEALEPHLFPPREDGTDPRLCPNCGKGRLSLRTARSGGAFIGCSNYPECRFTRPIGPPGAEDDSAADGPPDGKLLGVDPDRRGGHPAKTGRFGPYVQRARRPKRCRNRRAPPCPRAWRPATWIWRRR
jgi:DNA topoisomerase-1